MKSRKSSAFELVKTCCHVLDEKKAGDLQVLEVGELSSITDYLVLATATSAPHLRAMRVELEKTLKAAGVKAVGIETADESGWTIIDLFDVMIHLFREDVRAHYGLENLWKDAVVVSRPFDAPAKLKARARKTKPVPAKRKRAVRRK